MLAYTVLWALMFLPWQQISFGQTVPMEFLHAYGFPLLKLINVNLRRDACEEIKLIFDTFLR